MGMQHRGPNVRVTRHTRSMYADDLASYVAQMRAAGMRPGTITLKRQHLERCLSWLRMSPQEVTQDDLVRYLAAQNWAPETRKSVRSSLRGFFAWAEETGRVVKDPARRLPSITVPTGEPHPTPPEVFDAAMSVAAGRVRLMLMLGAYAGLRRAEIAAVHSRDLIGDELHIIGKGGKERTVPLQSDLLAALREVRGWAFPSASGGHLSADRVGRIMAKALPGDEWSAHSLRHRFATRTYAAERDLIAVQNMLGHASLTTTQRYTKAPDDAKRRAIQNVA